MKPIDKNEVEELIKNGELQNGTLLEFSDEGINWTPPMPFSGFSYLGEFPFESPYRWYMQARFPAPVPPDIRDGDPVFVRTHSSASVWRPRVAHCVKSDGRLYIYPDGQCPWTYGGGMRMLISRENWCKPTKEELEKAGLDPNWYDRPPTFAQILGSDILNETGMAWKEGDCLPPKTRTPLPETKWRKL